MDLKDPASLLDLAMQCLLKNEPIIIQSLEEIPRELLIPLFCAAFLGGHKKTLTAIVKVWPFFCLHVGKLRSHETHSALLKAMIDGLQVLPAPNSASRGSKLKILDLRQDANCRTTCFPIRTKSPFCFHSCSYTQTSSRKRKGKHSTVNLGSEVQLSRYPTELLVDLSLDGTLRTSTFLSLLLSKVEQSSGALHLCCRDLQVDKLSDYNNTLKLLNLLCIDHLAVDQASLNDINTLLSQMVHLDSLSLSKITLTSLNAKIFKSFLTQLERMDNLQELNLSFFCLTNRLHKLLRVLPHDLDYLNLPFCELSYRDFRFLSQCPQAAHLKLLNLSNNPISWEDCEPLQTLMENVSGTLQHLEINHCLITDSTIFSLLPALSHCSHLRVLSFASNPITMSMLMRVLENLLPLMELKYVIYPIPVHCYERWYFQGTLDRQKLADVQVQLKAMLQAAQRGDMNWITFSE
ncbi:melanoma antigen preferentially expressed in tumors-like [Rattus norvegicus]|uniref:PRAME like, X-linked 2 n=2 Tax=Rattus norvegicus TaxID=10116 RepID=F1M6Z3_RAT|nr:melanoma antigen preferentially expressed in tumors-like [Rattus norvegicus]|eukprot:XP_006232231.1 PREDICTED: melanoma antigen preferentially expressed in tumors-like [Rattus norvegicus]